MRALVLILFLAAFTACEHASENTPQAKDTIISQHTTGPEQSAGAYDSVVRYYIGKTGNPLIKAAQKEKLEWLLDRREQKDGKTFLVFYIGHDVSDAGKTNPRFATDDWVYIDSITKRIYAYDVSKDSIYEWKQ